MYKRNERLTELLLRELAGLLRSVKDPGLCGLVTVTGVELSKDRKTARVYYSVLGDCGQQVSTGEALGRAADYLRRRLRTRLTLKVVPQLDFRYDAAVERADRIDRILHRLQSER